MVISIIGPPGSGKTTQATKLSKKLDLPHLESGAVFREVSKEESDLGRRVKDTLERGLILSNQDTDYVISKMLALHEYHDHVIIDGFPRDLRQAQTYKGRIDRLFNLAVSDNECTRRLMGRGRSDDTVEVIKVRLMQYHLRTEPILQYYNRHLMLDMIDGEETPDTVFEELCDAVSRMLKSGEVELRS